MKTSPMLVAFAAVALLALRPTPAAAVAAPQPMMPLSVGERWEYVSPGGTHQVQIITNTRVILGRTVFAMSYTDGPDAGLENWWLTGPNGEVLLAGFDNPSFGRIAYEPPIELCSGVPVVGDVWNQHIVAYNLVDMSVFDQLDLGYSVLEDVSLPLPIGPTHAFGIGYVTSPTGSVRVASRQLTLTGRLAPTGAQSAATNANDWYSRGIGEVQYQASELFELASYGYVTPTLASSWGGLKARYR